MSTITVDEMTRDPAGWLKRVEAGEALTVLRDGTPVAEITPPPVALPPPGQPRPFGLYAGQFTVPDDFDDPLPDEIVDEFYK